MGQVCAGVLYIFFIFIFIKVHIVIHIMSVKNFVFIKSKIFKFKVSAKQLFKLLNTFIKESKKKIVRCLYF